MSLIVAGALFGEFWNGSRSAIFLNSLGCAAGCGLTGSCWDHGRIVLGSCSDRPRNVNDILAAHTLECHFSWQAQYLVMSLMLGYNSCCSARSIWRFMCDHDQLWKAGRRNIWWCWRVTSVASRNFNDVSCVPRINPESCGPSCRLA